MLLSFAQNSLRCWNSNVYFLSSQGYFLLFESMLDSVLYARDLYLADGGSGRSRTYSVLYHKIKVAQRIVTSESMCW